MKVQSTPPSDAGAYHGVSLACLASWHSKAPISAACGIWDGHQPFRTWILDKTPWVQILAPLSLALSSQADDFASLYLIPSSTKQIILYYHHHHHYSTCCYDPSHSMTPD